MRGKFNDFLHILDNCFLEFRSVIVMKVLMQFLEKIGEKIVENTSQLLKVVKTLLIKEQTDSTFLTMGMILLRTFFSSGNELYDFLPY
jgi:hypothetical protein